MAEAKRRYTGDVPDDVTERLRQLCRALPDAYEEPAWVGTRWRVRTKTFAHVLGMEAAGEHRVVMTFRSGGEELEVLRSHGFPYLALGWGRDALGLVIDATTDWDEVRELVTESYCVMAPTSLAARVDRPPPTDA